MASPDFTQSITHPAHLPVIYVMLLFTFLVACICTLGGLQETGTTHKFSDVNVKNDLNVDGTLSLTQGNFAATNATLSGNLAVAGNFSGAGQTYVRVSAPVQLPLAAGVISLTVQQPANTILVSAYLANSGTQYTGNNVASALGVQMGTDAAATNIINAGVASNIMAVAAGEVWQANTAVALVEQGTLTILPATTAQATRANAPANAITSTRGNIWSAAAATITATLTQASTATGGSSVYLACRFIQVL